MRTSITDCHDYINITDRAVKDNDVFCNFKRDTDYRKVLEHVSYEEGLNYFAAIEKQSPELLQYFDKFRENDKLGNPIKFAYKNHGEFSPTTLRYIKVLSDLKTNFGDLNGFNIIEIGGGYGGQCKTISDVYKFQSYTIVDLPNVLLLIDKYLTALGVHGFNLCSAEDLNIDATYDLVISNYAFTECVREVQNLYLEKVLKHSKKGYLTCNFISNYYNLDSFSQYEVFKMIESPRIFQEPISTNPDNFILTWDNL